MTEFSCNVKDKCTAFTDYCPFGAEKQVCTTKACTIDDKKKTDTCKGYYTCDKTTTECEFDAKKALPALMAEIKIISDKIKSNPCFNQQSFSNAFSKAVDDKQKNSKMSTALIIYIVIHLMFSLVGIMFALKQPIENRTANITLAIIYGPAYVIAHFITNLKK